MDKSLNCSNNSLFQTAIYGGYYYYQPIYAIMDNLWIIFSFLYIFLYILCTFLQIVSAGDHPPYIRSQNLITLYVGQLSLDEQVVHFSTAPTTTTILIYIIN